MGSARVFNWSGSVLKVIPLIFIATVGMFYAFRIGAWPEFNPSGGSTFSALATAVALATFAYVGVETASIAASKVRNPVKNDPIATMLGTLGTAVVYLLVTVAIYGIVPNEVLQNTTAPFSVALDTIFGGTWGGRLVALFAVISGIGALNSWAMICGEVPQAAARNKVFPQLFAKENKAGVPYWGIISGQVLAFGLVIIAFSGQTGVAVYNMIVLMSNVAVGVPYFFSALSQLYYLYTEGRQLHRTFAREVVIAVIALAFTFYMIFGAGSMSVYIGFLVYLVGWIVMMTLYVKTGKYGATSLDDMVVDGDAHTADATAGTSATQTRTDPTAATKVN